MNAPARKLCETCEFYQPHNRTCSEKMVESLIDGQFYNVSAEEERRPGPYNCGWEAIGWKQRTYPRPNPLGVK